MRRRAGAQSRGPRGHRATEAEERREPGLQGEEHLGTLNLTEECLFLADFKTNVSNKKSYISGSKTFSPFISYQTTRFPKLNPFQVFGFIKYEGYPGASKNCT